VQYVNSKGLLDLKPVDGNGDKRYGIATTELQSKKAAKKAKKAKKAKEAKEARRAKDQEFWDGEEKEGGMDLKPDASVGTTDISKYQVGQEVTNMAGHEIGYVIEIAAAEEGANTGAGLIRVSAHRPAGEYEEARSAFAEKK
jgi:sRNA-binding protein